MGFDIYTGQNKGTGGLGRSLPCVLVHVEAKSGRGGGARRSFPWVLIYIYRERPKAGRWGSLPGVLLYTGQTQDGGEGVVVHSRSLSHLRTYASH